MPARKKTKLLSPIRPPRPLPPARPNTSPTFCPFDPTGPPLLNSPSPYNPHAWGELLAPYPGDLGSLCVGILTFGAQIGLTALPLLGFTKNYPIGNLDIITA